MDGNSCCISNVENRYVYVSCDLGIDFVRSVSAKDNSVCAPARSRFAASVYNAAIASQSLIA